MSPNKKVQICLSNYITKTGSGIPRVSDMCLYLIRNVDMYRIYNPGLLKYRNMHSDKLEEIINWGKKKNARYQGNATTPV